MVSAILNTFAGALQASLSVLLVIFYGVIASQYDLIDTASAKKVSHFAVKLCLPFLIITKVGGELSLSSAPAYGPILIWALFYNLVSMGIGLLGARLFGLPAWVTPAVAFNNTTSLPLLLVQSLKSTGLLDILVRGDENSINDAINKAQTYFLINSVVSNCLTFALGPRLLDEPISYTSDSEEDTDSTPSTLHHPEDVETTALLKPPTARHTRHILLRLNSTDDLGSDSDTESDPDPSQVVTSLLPDRLNHHKSLATAYLSDLANAHLVRTGLHWSNLNPRTRNSLQLLASFFNAPLVGALIGILVGLIPPFHTAFFADTQHGGIFTAWLTSSIRNTGDLFVSLQVILVGVKLSSSLRKMKRGEGELAGHLPVSAAVFVFVVRYIFWPVVSIPVIWGLASHGVLRSGANDAILWFSMMLMPTGPPSISLIPMADVSGKDEKIKMTVAKLLVVMYAVSPMLAVVVVGSLKVTQRVMDA